MARPPFVMSKYASREDLLADASNYYEALSRDLLVALKQAMQDQDGDWWHAAARAAIAKAEGAE